MTRLLLIVLVLSATSASSMAEGTQPVDTAADSTAQTMSAAPLAEIVTPADSLPYLRYLSDGQITLNNRCPVRKVKLNPRMGASYVNGRPVGFC